MNKLTLALTAILFLVLALMMAPNILALNRGKILRNTAIWLAIFVVLGLLYQYFGPGRSLRMQVPTPPAQANGPLPPPNSGDHGFTPPKE
jgi:hypothetical protein